MLYGGVVVALPPISWISKSLQIVIEFVVRVLGVLVRFCDRPQFILHGDLRARAVGDVLADDRQVRRRERRPRQDAVLPGLVGELDDLRERPFLDDCGTMSVGR